MARGTAARGVPQIPRAVQGEVHTSPNTVFQSIQIELQLHCVRRDFDLNMSFVLNWVRCVLFCLKLSLALNLFFPFPVPAHPQLHIAPHPPVSYCLTDVLVPGDMPTRLHA